LLGIAGKFKTNFFLLIFLIVIVGGNTTRLFSSSFSFVARLASQGFILVIFNYLRASHSSSQKAEKTASQHQRSVLDFLAELEAKIPVFSPGA